MSLETIESLATIKKEDGMKGKQWHDNNSAASYLGVSPRTTELWRVQGRGPVFCKMGKKVLYRECDLEAYIERAQRRSTSDDGTGC